MISITYKSIGYFFKIYLFDCNYNMLSILYVTHLFLNLNDFNAILMFEYNKLKIYMNNDKLVL